MKKTYKYFLFALLVIMIDQAIKLWMHFVVVPQHFGEIDLWPNVFKLHYVLNPGMAFGIELGGSWGKLFLTLFRVTACIGIIWYMLQLAKKNTHNGLLYSMAAILGGALGNVIDSTFYGVFLEGNKIEGAATPWFHGQVIDMFYAEFFDGYWPDWIPVLGGRYNLTPIFNFADAAIFCGVVSILIFQKHFLEENLSQLEPSLDDELLAHEAKHEVENPEPNEETSSTILTKPSDESK